ncbi:hypothetical protein PSN45_001355 [Yamadazyma tenuis]|uniref:UPF0075-domain-containing protein n=1 Tax=Candida tenuis (strain ATCC 10573 / BCRC 21748 / CBS 615 / JCM 9827 / NBRC 10315 / NRRL Y-1498 / VKM Y-70) TaxID=590646 RepID=G3BCQ1_CANTC|nr:UPF0075-domain-containing protein [Yamadazyma tenuis ATCC 10573]EGV60852.1 UPF0075-domain-containing protein [Yamadazyma tenuis ATCC 10573]WEJ93878.1 hypothetical protein PSN45_001355 [Yamadazyma tenuis]
MTGKKLNVVGLNCGTSIDGIDVAQLEVSLEQADNAAGFFSLNVKLLHYSEAQIDPHLKKLVLDTCYPGKSTTIADVCDLNFAIGEAFGNAVLDSGINLDEVDLISSHGQTVWHEPRGGVRNSTLQLGEPSVISQLTGKTVVSGFRTAEVAVGRQGAPICGFLESALLHDDAKVIISQNIGGIGNATVIDPKLTFFQFDTGPGNMMIDTAVKILTDNQKQYDVSGSMANEGENEIDHEYVEAFLNQPYFGLSPPKTTGRELFGDNVSERITKELISKGLSPSGVVATITRITSESISRAYEMHVLPQVTNSEIDEIYLCGGGAYNTNLVKNLQKRFPTTKVAKLNERSPVNAESKEAVAFAILGYLCITGAYAEIPRFSESEEKTHMGVITPGKNFNRLFSWISGLDGMVLKNVIVK